MNHLKIIKLRSDRRDIVSLNRIKVHAYSYTNKPSTLQQLWLVFLPDNCYHGNSFVVNINFGWPAQLQNSQISIALLFKILVNVVLLFMCGMKATVEYPQIIVNVYCMVLNANNSRKTQ